VHQAVTLSSTAFPHVENEKSWQPSWTTLPVEPKQRPTQCDSTTSSISRQIHIIHVLLQQRVTYAVVTWVWPSVAICDAELHCRAQVSAATLMD